MRSDRPDMERGFRVLSVLLWTALVLHVVVLVGRIAMLVWP